MRARKRVLETWHTPPHHPGLYGRLLWYTQIDSRLRGYITDGFIKRKISPVYKDAVDATSARATCGYVRVGTGKLWISFSDIALLTPNVLVRSVRYDGLRSRLALNNNALLVGFVYCVECFFDNLLLHPLLSLYPFLVGLNAVRSIFNLKRASSTGYPHQYLRSICVSSTIWRIPSKIGKRLTCFLWQ